MQKIWGFSADDDFIAKTISRIASYFSSLVSCMSTTCIIITFKKEATARAREVGKRGDAFHNMHTLDNLHAFLPSFYAL